MQKETTCCFTGHRTMPTCLHAIKKNLEKSLCRLIDEGFISFCSGGALGFDMLAAETVLHLRKKHPQIKLIMILPCTGQDRFWTKKQKAAYAAVLAAADKVIYTGELYHRGCMQKRNRCLVDASSRVLAYLEKDSGGTKYTVDYAENLGVEVENLFRPRKCQLSFFS
ncbi:MAG: DUF1273 family protein [Clostridia bacterium]|nr:DUF1273 family protein [Clostridia bacterium]